MDGRRRKKNTPTKAVAPRPSTVPSVCVRFKLAELSPRHGMAMGARQGCGTDSLWGWNGKGDKSKKSLEPFGDLESWGAVIQVCTVYSIPTALQERERERGTSKGE